MNIADRVRADLVKVGMVVGGHFVLKSKLHSETFINVKGLPRELAYDYTFELTKDVRRLGVEVVIGPETGGTILAELMGSHLSRETGRFVQGMSAPKDDNKVLYLRVADQAMLPGKKVCIVEDVMTTGGTILRLREAVEAAGGTIVALCVVVNRCPDKGLLGDVPTFSLYKPVVETWSEEECRRCGPCSRNVPINTDLGHGKQYLDQLAAT